MSDFEAPRCTACFGLLHVGDVVLARRMSDGSLWARIHPDCEYEWLSGGIGPKREVVLDGLNFLGT